MGRLIDIRETDFGIENVTDYTISRGKQSAGEDFSFTLPGIDGLHAPGTTITIKGMESFITQRRFQADRGGYKTTLSGVSKIADIIRKAPGKSLTFMSMTPDELEQFQIANMTEEGTIDYNELRYVPLIKVCDSQLFTGGWDLNSVIDELASRMGLQIVCNVRNYWLRQVQADMQSSYFDTIISLINFLRPFVYIQDGILYILNKDIEYAISIGVGGHLPVFGKC